MARNRSQQLDKYRKAIARRVRALRGGRRWTQAELASMLRISQGRLSELERGDGSFSAEQLLVLLQVFNVTLADLVDERPAPQALQNALARLGATHLVEDPDVLPVDWVDDLERTIGEALAAGTPRLVTALAPVVVRNASRLNVVKLRSALAEVGIHRRLDWLIDNVLAAIDIELRDDRLPRAVAQSYRRVRTQLELSCPPLGEPSREVEQVGHDALRAFDLLDPQIRSKETANDLLASASPLARRRGIITALTELDFVEALRATRVEL